MARRQQANQALVHSSRMRSPRPCSGSAEISALRFFFFILLLFFDARDTDARGRKQEEQEQVWAARRDAPPAECA